MTMISIKRSINAPTDLVFDTVADITNFSKAIPHITKVEFLTEQRVGAGTKFRETRLMGGREAQTELEVTEYVENDHVRLVADSHGTIWDTIFSVQPDGDGTLLAMEMTATARQLLPKLLNPILKYMIKGAIEKDLDAVKSYCENIAG